MTGVIQGGWEFVVGAYGWTAVVLGVYVFAVIRQHSKEFANLERRATQVTEGE